MAKTTKKVTKIKVNAEQLRIIKGMSEHFNKAFGGGDLAWCLALLHQNVELSEKESADVTMPEWIKGLSKEE